MSYSSRKEPSPAEVPGEGGRKTEWVVEGSYKYELST